MVATVWTVAIDFNDDGDFSDTNEDISAHVRSFKWRRGMSTQFQFVADPAYAEVLLNNWDGSLSPETSALGFDRGKRLRISSVSDAGTNIHFTGFIREFVVPRDDPYVVKIVVDGALAQVAAATVTVERMLSVTTDEVLTVICDGVKSRRAILKDVFIVGVDGHNELGVSTYLAGETFDMDFATGLNEWSYVGDLWSEGVNALDAIKQLVTAEVGRFYEDGDGALVFINREEVAQAAVGAVDATFDRTQQEFFYSFGHALINAVKVTYIPRSVGGATDTLWTLASGQRIGRASGDDEPKRLRVLFRDGSGRRMGALSVISPVSTTDFTANDEEDGTGTDRTSLMSVEVIEQDFSSAVLQINHTHSSDIYLEAGSKVRGQPLEQGDPVTVEVRDYESEAFYSAIERKETLNIIDTYDRAITAATWLLGRRYDPTGLCGELFVEIGILGAANVLNRALFDVVAVRTSVDSSRNYFLVGEEHEVIGGVHKLRWVLETVESSQAWILGTHTLDEGTYLG